MTQPTPDPIQSIDALRAVYGDPSERALKKEMRRLDHHCRAFIAVSPFVVLATSGADGRQDCSPRGDAPGFVQVVDEQTLLVPDRRGNNRVDSLANVLENPHVGMLFMVPGMNETLRVNGRGRIVRAQAVLAPLAVRGRVPRSALRVEVEEVFLQCAKALVRSRLWDADARIDRSAFPTMGRMLADQIDGVDAERFDREAAALIRSEDGLC